MNNNIFTLRQLEQRGWGRVGVQLTMQILGGVLSPYAVKPVCNDHLYSKIYYYVNNPRGARRTAEAAHGKVPATVRARPRKASPSPCRFHGCTVEV